jgi:gliding motility-associated-like protein
VYKRQIFNNDSTCSGTAIQFQSVVTGTGPFVYTWNFGDGTTSTDKDPVHSYNSVGCSFTTFNVTLTVSNDSLSELVAKRIKVIQKPDVGLTDVNSPFDPFSNCSNASILNPSYSIKVGYYQNSTCVSSYSLNWGDGSAVVANPSFPLEHTYNNLGAFDMVLTAQGTNGCEANVKYVVKNQTNPSGGLISPGTTTNLCAPTDSLEFEIAKWGTNSPGTRYIVNYGDGSPLLQLTQEQLVKSPFYNAADPAMSGNYPIPHVYSTTNCPASEFTATLTVQNACDRTTFTADNITILIKPEVDFEIPPACLNAPILIKNTTNPGGGINCSPLANYLWNFGDGTPTVSHNLSNPQNINHTYDQPGTYFITVMARNFCGEDTLTKPVIIKPLPTATLKGDALVCQGANPPLVVFTAENGEAPYTFTYKINNTENQTITTDSLSNSVSVEVPTDQPGKYTYTLISVSEGSESECNQVQSGIATIEVVSAVSATVKGTDTVCVNASSPQIVFTGRYGLPPYTFTYNINGGNSQTISTIAGDTVSIFAPTNLGGTFVYNLTGVTDSNPNASSCSLELNENVSVFVNEQPPEPLVLVNYEFCNGETTPVINFSNSVPGTSYQWNNSNTSIGLAGSGTGSIGAFTAQNGTSNPILSTITVIASSYACTSPPQNFDIKVNPAASVIFSGENQSICSGESTSEISLSSETSGVDLNWTVEQPEGINETLQLSGTNSIPSQTFTNNTGNPVIINYKATATLPGAGICAGVENTYSVTVNPRPLIQGIITDTICSGYRFDINPQHGGNNIVPVGTQYTWGEPLITPAGALSGFSAQNTAVPEIAQTLVNTTTSLATATYRITPVTNHCQGEDFELTVYVIPNTSLIPVANITLCSGDNQNELVFGNNSAGTVLKWTSDNGNIGIPLLSGSNVLPAFTAINPGNAPEQAVISVESNSELGTSSCDVARIEFAITVNPAAQVNNPGAHMVCSGDNILIPFSTVNTGGTTTYAWTNSNPSIGLDSKGTGDISFSTINSTDSVITTVISVTPTYSNNGLSCAGKTEHFEIKVNPPVLMDQPEDYSVCSGNQSREIVFSGNSAETIYNWSINNSTIGLSLQGTGSIPEFTAFNDNSDSIDAIVTVVPSINGCEGEPRQFKLTVFPSSIILKQPSSSSICLGEIPVPLSVIHTSGVSQPNYQWYSNTSDSFIGAKSIPGETGSVFTPPVLGTNTTYYFCEIHFPGGGGCNSLTSEIVKVQVSPNPYIVLNDEQINRGDELIICPNEEVPIHVRGAENYQWSYGFSGDSVLVSKLGDYRVIGISKAGCRDTFPFSVAHFESRNYTIESDRNEINNDQSMVYFSTQEIPGSFYQWNFGDGETAYGSAVNHSFNIMEDGYIDVVLQVENPDGCFEEASYRIWTSIASIPNTFTPNGDGINDYYLSGWLKKIYNRNGVLLYEGKEGWDGTYKGNPVANDTYFVVVFDSSETGASKKTNYVTVIR